MAKQSPMVVAAAREMSRLSAEACGINLADNWTIYGDSFLEDAAKVLDAAGVPELVLALKQLLLAYREAVKLYDPNHDDAFTVDAHNAIAKAEGTPL